MLAIKCGDIIHEYSMRTDETDDEGKLFSSYLVITPHRGAESGQPAFKCMCLYNVIDSCPNRPGQIVIFRSDWISSKHTSEEKNWPTFWERV